MVPKMLMFTLAISCLTTSNLPWFMDLTFQVPMQYCSLQHWTLCSPPDTSITGILFHFGSATSFFLELLLHSILNTYQPSGLIFQWHIFLPFHTVHGVLKTRHWSRLPFLSPEPHVLSELSTMTCPSCADLHGMAHSFVWLHKAVIYMIIWLVLCHSGFLFGGHGIVVLSSSLCPLIDEGKRLEQASW